MDEKRPPLSVCNRRRQSVVNTNMCLFAKGVEPGERYCYLRRGAEIAISEPRLR